MNTIKRDVYVLKNTIKIPIEVTKGTDMVGIEFTVRDFNIPVTAAAVAYSYNKKMKKPNSQLCDVKGNVISFTPGRKFFEVGMNEIQIRVINEDKALISFKEKVKCSDAMGFPDDEGEKQQTLIEQLVSNSGKETGERKKADETERNERTQADTTEKSERKAEIDVERKRIDNLVDRLDKDYELAYGTWYAVDTVIPLADSYLNYRDIIVRVGWNNQNGGVRDNRISINNNGTTLYQTISVYQATKYIGVFVVEFNPATPKQIKIVQSSGVTSSNASNGIRGVFGRTKLS